MAGPYDIQQVDVPGLLGLHQGLKRQRISDLMAAREYEMKARQAERQDRKDQALASIFMKGGGQASGGAGATVQSPASDTPDPSAFTAPVQDVDSHPLANHSLDQPLPPRTDGLTINQEALQGLYAVDPQAASQIQRMIYDSSKQQLEQATARGEAMAVAADALRGLPEGQRQAEFQSRWAPWLADRGYTSDMLRQADLSDQGLDTYYKQGMTLSQVVAKNKPDLRVIPYGAQVRDFSQGGSGVQLAKNGPSVGTVTDGYRFKGGNPNDPSAWEEVGSGNATGDFQ